LGISGNAIFVASRREAEPNVLVRYYDRPILLEVSVAAGVVAVEMSVEDVFDRQRRDLLDRGLDLVAKRRKLSVHHDDAVGADGDGDVATPAFEHIGVMTEVGLLDLHTVPIDLLLRVGAGGEGEACARKRSQIDPPHG
jgi:hypothetical protein